MSKYSNFISPVEKTLPTALRQFRNKDDVGSFFADCYEFVYNLEKNDEYREVLYDFLKDVQNKENHVVFVNICKNNYFDCFSVYQTLSWDELCYEFDVTFEVKDSATFKDEVFTFSQKLRDDYKNHELLPWLNCQSKISLIILDWVQDLAFTTLGIPIVYSFDNEPKLVSAIPVPISYNEPVNPKKKVVKVLEKDLEKDLVKWLDIHGVVAETQTAVGSYRTDVWIPGVCFLELKRGKVTAKDFCQALRYSAETDRKIILVGKNVEKDVVETISMYNDLLECEKITFVSWDTVKIYLKGLLGF